MSTLKVDTIQGKTGDTVDFSGNNNITMFQVNTTLTISSSSLSTITDWTESNSQSTFGFKRVGSAVSVSSGEFTVSRLGVYRVYLQLSIYNQGGSAEARYFQCDLGFTPNGGSGTTNSVAVRVSIKTSSGTSYLNNSSALLTLTLQEIQG